MLPEITDQRVQERQWRRIDRDRSVWRDADQRSLTQRELADEIASESHGIAQHVERVGGACVVGELREPALQITLDAVLGYPDLDAQFRAGIEKPMSLWSALALDHPTISDHPTIPTERELRELRARVDRLRGEHNRYVAALVPGMDNDAILAAELEVAIRRYLAAVAWQAWHEATVRAEANKHNAVEHRQARVRHLARMLRVGEPDGWTFVGLANLLLASGRDWAPPPCPLLVAKYGAQRDADCTDDRLGGLERLADLLRKDLQSTEPKP